VLSHDETGKRLRHFEEKERVIQQRAENVRKKNGKSSRFSDFILYKRELFYKYLYYSKCMTYSE